MNNQMVAHNWANQTNSQGKGSNFFYEGKNQLNKKIVKVGFTGLRKVKFLRDVFIKQAMGRINLTD